jgi:hypothetical protein
MKLAVLLCGDLRMWQKAHTSIFRHLETISADIDYYFVTWTTTQDFWYPDPPPNPRSVLETEITSKFVNRNLIDYRLIDQNSVVPPNIISFYYVGYLSKIANILKRQHELSTGTIYDQVIELRPDLYFSLGNYQLGPKINNFEVGVASLFYTGKIPAIQDFYFVTNSFTNDILGNRHTYKKETRRGWDLFNRRNHTQGLLFITDNHWVYLDYINRRRMVIKKLQWPESHIVRPNFPDNLDNISREDIIKLVEEWRSR